MTSTSKYYQESGEISPVNFALGAVGLLIITLILGYIYGILSYYIPIVYANIVLAIGLGFALGFAIRLVYRLAKCRSKKSRLTLMILGLLFVTYFQWTAFLDSLLLGRFPTPIEMAGWIFDPSNLSGLIGQIYEHGTWGFGDSDSAPINGPILLAIWLGEIFLTAMPSLKSVGALEVYPYSESLGQWYPKYTLEDDFESIASKNSIEEKLDADVLETLRALPHGNGIKHSKIFLYYLEGEANQYLSINRIYVEDGGAGDTNVTPLIQNYRIDTTIAKTILAEFRNRKDSLGVF